MKLSLVIVILCSFFGGYAQDSTYNLRLENKEISFSVYRYGVDFTSDIKPKSEMVVETNIKDALVWNQIKSLSAEKWLTLLYNPNTDWAANLVLYQLYEKDAVIFKIIKKREDWLGKQRDKDIEYWKIFLSSASRLPQKQ